MRKTQCITFLFSLYSVSATAQELISARTDSLIQLGIRWSIEQSFDKAVDLFVGLQNEMPQSPVGYFFHAAALQLRMMDSETYDKEADFLSLIDNTIKLSKTRLQGQRNDAWAYFFMGSAYGYLAFYRAKQDHFVESFQNGRKCVEALETALSLDKNLHDAYLALGNYKYYRSKLSRHLNWLPFVNDDRQEAIQMLKKTISSGRYSKYSAINSFCWIAIEEENYEEGWKVVKTALDEFPESRVFLWCAAKLAVKLERWKEAESYYLKILAALTERGTLSAYNELICRKNLFYIYERLGREGLAQQQCGRVSEIGYGPANPKRSRKILKEMKEACSRSAPTSAVGQSGR
jgi:tetratricopeptide (TPR) repeat protein